MRFTDAFLQRRRPFRALPAELAARLPTYADDWVVGLRHPLKVLASALFMFFVSVFPALTFGNELAIRTKMQYGIMEVLLSCAVCGTAMALFSGQPLVIVGVTGPITAFSTSMYHLARGHDYNFLALMFWTCLWAGVMHMLLAAFNACDDIVEYVTRYSCEIFSLLIAVIYIVNGVGGVVRRYHGTDPLHMSKFLLVMLNTLVVSVLSLKLSSAQSWWVLTPRIRFYIADWGVSIAVICMWIVVSQLPPWNHVKLRKLPVPDTFRPSHRRPWLVDPFAGPADTPAFALFPALILTTLILFDHNVSSLLAQSPRHGLRKPPTYNYDFLLVGITIIVCGALGLPPSHGLIPQAALHVESLVCEDHSKRPTCRTPPSPRQAAHRVAACCTGWLTGSAGAGEVPSRGGSHVPTPPSSDGGALIVNGASLDARHPGAHYVVETRWSALLQSAAIGLATMPVFLRVIRNMPPSLLYGSFIYMGVASFAGNQLAARVIALTVTEPRYRLARYLSAHISPRILAIPPGRLVLFTALQFACLLAIVLVTVIGGPAAISFPLLIMLLIPLRHSFFPQIFTPEQLAILDTWSAWPPPPPPAPAAHPPADGGYPPSPPPPLPLTPERTPTHNPSTNHPSGNGPASTPGNGPLSAPSNGPPCAPPGGPRPLATAGECGGSLQLASKGESRPAAEGGSPLLASKDGPRPAAGSGMV